MFFGIFILSRVLFIASMVFIIGYVFGNFSKNRTLTRITKVATIVSIVLFIGSNIFLFRGGPRGFGKHHVNQQNCHGWHMDSTGRK